jgi:hypothetical protein
MPSSPIAKLKQVLRPESQGPSSLKAAESGPRKSSSALSPRCRVGVMGPVGEPDGGLFLLQPGLGVGELGLDDEGGTG